MFSNGQECKRLFFAHDDSFWYLKFDLDCEQVPESTWISEIALWTSWSHKGTLQAKNESELMAIDVELGGKALRGHPDAFDEASQYGKAFVTGLNRIGNLDVTDLYESPRTEGLWMRLLNEFDVDKRGARGSMAYAGGSTIGSMRFRSTLFSNRRSTIFSSARRSQVKGSQVSGFSRIQKSLAWALSRSR